MSFFLVLKGCRMFSCVCFNPLFSVCPCFSVFPLLQFTPPPHFCYFIKSMYDNQSDIRGCRVFQMVGASRGSESSGFFLRLRHSKVIFFFVVVVQLVLPACAHSYDTNLRWFFTSEFHWLLARKLVLQPYFFNVIGPEAGSKVQIGNVPHLQKKPWRFTPLKHAVSVSSGVMSSDWMEDCHMLCCSKAIFC